MARYLVHLLATAFTLLSSVAAINWLIDPYSIWNTPKIHGLNTVKPKLADHHRIYKIVGLARHPANTVILGTSRSDIGLNPNHSALGQNALNLATAGQPYRETRMLFNWLNDREAIKTFVIGLDFFVANIFYTFPADFVAENFTNERGWQLAISGSTLMDSVNTIAKRKVLLSDTWSEKGLRLWSDEYVKNGGGSRKIMHESEKGYLTQYYLPPPSCSFSLASTGLKLTPLEEIRAIFSRAYREHISLKLLISPSHARQWETLAAAGLWDKWEEWKRHLVQMNEDEAQRTGQTPFPLWDFSGYNSISTETVPVLDDTETIMRWYFESSHYTPATGNLVLNRIFNLKSTDLTVPDDFGTLLTSRNIDTHLAHIRAAREHYRQTHPEDVAEIEAMAREVVKTKQCKTQLPRN